MNFEIAAKLRDMRVYEGLSERDQMLNPVNGLARYLDVGRSGLRVALTALTARLGYPGGEEPIASILDFGSAYGRVTRFFVAAFPIAAISVADLNEDATKWCADHLRVSVVKGELPEAAYDLIFLGSVLTHQPEQVAAAILHKLVKALRQNGILIVTAQGRYASAEINSKPTRPLYLQTLEQTNAMHAGYLGTGYGFAEYTPGRGYGSSMITPGWFAKTIGNSPELLQVLFQEKGFDNHQDVYGYMKSRLLDTGRSGL